MFMLRSSLAWFYEETFRWGPDVAVEAAHSVFTSPTGLPFRLAIINSGR